MIAAITSCTNTSNPSVMLGAGLVAKKAHELGLQVSITMLRLSFLVFVFASTNKRDTFFLLYAVLFFLKF